MTTTLANELKLSLRNMSFKRDRFICAGAASLFLAYYAVWQILGDHSLASGITLLLLALTLILALFDTEAFVLVAPFWGGMLHLWNFQVSQCVAVGGEKYALRSMEYLNIVIVCVAALWLLAFLRSFNEHKYLRPLIAFQSLALFFATQAVAGMFGMPSLMGNPAGSNDLKEWSYVLLTFWAIWMVLAFWVLTPLLAVIYQLLRMPRGELKERFTSLITQLRSPRVPG